MVLFSIAQNNPVAMTGTATITDAGTATNTITVVGSYKSVSIQAVVTQLTGTVTGVTAILSGSIDGTNYVNLNTDTLTCTAQTTNTKIWVLKGSNYKYYKISYGSGTTTTARVQGYLFAAEQTGKHAASNMLASDATAYDTITNTGSGQVVLQVKGNYNTISIQAIATKLSGTNGGTITLQGSNDGTNYVTVSTGYLMDVTTSSPYAISGGATLTVLNQTTTTKIFTVIGNPYAYYRLNHTGTGTMSSKLSGLLMPNY